MSALTEPPQGSFRLSMLLSDTRYRSYTFQFIALACLIAAMAFLGANLLSNLAAQGLDISYDFLGSASGYDINQTPIPYDSQDTHLRASMVGIINTLIVAVLACITATVIGVIAGVLRLSNNWLVRKIMAIYVEAFRNVPVLIWILIIFSIMTVSLPAPSAFRGETPEATMLFDAFAFTNRGIYTPTPVWTVGTISVFATFLLSVIAVFAYRRFAVRALYERGEVYPVSWPSIAVLIIPTLLVLLVPANGILTLIPALLKAAIFVGVIGGVVFLAVRGVQALSAAVGPIATAAALVAVIFIGWYFGFILMIVYAWSLTGVGNLNTFVDLDLPALKGFNFQGGMQIRGSLIALWFALAVYTGAFIAENVRAGIQAISKGQTEAAAALGLRPKRIMNLVVLPQALRVIIPPLVSQYLNITKNSSLAIAVGYMDITGTLGGITLNQTGRAIESVLLLMLFYLVISLSISTAMNLYNNSVKLRER